ncbi:MAG: transcription factor S [Promethearchaeota archaeon]|nr:MAG: transcription factor S [Candidatus Lokiarchaeota archaeon]
MVEFCPECSSVLRKRLKDGEEYLICKCGYEKQINTNPEEIEKVIKKKQEALSKNLIVVSQEDKIAVHPTVTVECPKCGHMEAEAWQEQTRSADEPSTSFFRCLKCKYTWREY